MLAASDESFGEKENLLTPTAAFFEPGHYSHRGEIVDGWETKRRREPGHDRALIRLGAPGILTSIDVDTSFFTGNFPPSCRIEACGCEGYPSPQELNGPGIEWIEIVPRMPLAGDRHNQFTNWQAEDNVGGSLNCHIPLPKTLKQQRCEFCIPSVLLLVGQFRGESSARCTCWLGSMLLK